MMPQNNKIYIKIKYLLFIFTINSVKSGIRFTIDSWSVIGKKQKVIFNIEYRHKNVFEIT